MSSNKALAVEIRAEVGAYIQGLIDAMRATETNAKKMRNSLENVSSKNSQMSFQNLGYQVNDVAAQFAAGTNVIQAFGQQAGQMLQAFGPYGSILGAAVAVAASFASKLMDGKDAAEKAEKAHRDYAGAVDFARQITERADETNRRHLEEKRQETIETLRAAAAEKVKARAVLEGAIAHARAGEAAAAALKDRMAAAGTGQTAIGAGVVDVGAQRAAQRIADLEDQLLKLNKSATETGGLLTTALNPPKGWDSAGGGFKRDNDALEDYMTSLRQSVELQKLDERERAAREAVIRAENAAQQEQRVLTAAQAAEVRKLALARYDLEKSQKLNKKDSLAEYMDTLHDAVELEKLDTRERAAREAVMKAENAAQQEQRVLTADQAAEVRELALARYDLEQAHKPQKDDGIEAYIEKLKDSADVMAVENRERAIRQALIEAQNIAMKEETVLTDDQVAKITKLAGATYDLKEAQDKAKDSARDHERLMKEVGQTFSSAFEDAIVAGKKFSNVLQGLSEDIARLIIRQSITAPLGSAISSAVSGFSGSLFSGLFGGGLTGSNYSLGTPQGYTPSFVNGARATGGSVNAGGSYLVGEKGPEIVKFNSPGTVIPNNRIGGMGSGEATVINQTIQISTGVSQTVRAEILNQLPMIANATKAAISNDQARKGRSL